MPVICQEKLGTTKQKCETTTTQHKTTRPILPTKKFYYKCYTGGVTCGKLQKCGNQYQKSLWQILRA